MIRMKRTKYLHSKGINGYSFSKHWIVIQLGVDMQDKGFFFVFVDGVCSVFRMAMSRVWVLRNGRGIELHTG